MIFELIVGALASVFEALLGLFPQGEAPTWVADVNGLFAEVWASAYGLGAWIPFSLAGQIFSAVIVAIGVGFLIKVIRIIASFFTAGGGSAA